VQAAMTLLALLIARAAAGDAAGSEAAGE
jgi:hypothetical protein